MKKNKKLQLKKETITILDKMQTENVVGGILECTTAVKVNYIVKSGYSCACLRPTYPCPETGPTCTTVTLVGECIKP